MALNYQQLLFDRIWQIWETYPAFVDQVKRGNRIKTGEGVGWLKTMMMASKPADYPWVKLEIPRTTHSTFELINTLDTMDDDFIDARDASGARRCSGEVRRTFEVKATFMSMVLRDYEQDQLVEIAIDALISKGPAFGLADVNTFGPIVTNQTELSDAEAKGSRRLRTIMTFPVLFIFELRDILV